MGARRNVTISKEPDMAKKKPDDADIGHNSNGAADAEKHEMTAEERKTIFFHHYRRIANKKAMLDALREEYKTLRKEAKADGIVLADMDFALRCAEVDDAGIIPEELRRRSEIAAWFALPVHYQADLFEDTRPLEDRAYEEGRAAGLQAKDGSSPYEGAVGQKWMQGWHDGQAAVRDEMVAEIQRNNALAKAMEAPADNDDADPFDDELPDAAE